MSGGKLTREDLRAAAEKYKNWGKWGAIDEIGTLNYTRPEDIVAAARLFLTSADAVIAGDQALALVNVIDSGSGRSLIAQTTAGNDSPLDNWFGTGKNPAYWPFPKILRPNSVVTVQLTNLEATARNYRLSFIGFKIFRSGANDAFSFTL